MEGLWFLFSFSSVQFTQSCLTLCDPMNRSMPDLPVHHKLPEFTQTHVHWVSDAIQPPHPLWSPSPPVPNPSQHRQLFAWGGQSIGVSASTSVLPKNTQDWSALGWTGWISLMIPVVYYKTGRFQPTTHTHITNKKKGKSKLEISVFVVMNISENWQTSY